MTPGPPPTGLGREARRTEPTPGGESADVRFRLVFENNPLPIWIFDRETLRFLEVNEAAIRDYGYTRDEFLAMTVIHIRPAEDVPRLIEALAPLRPGERMTGLWRHRKKDGTLIDVEVLETDVPFDTRPGRLVLVHDVTQRLRTERRRTTEMAVTRILLESPTFLDAAPPILATIAEAEGWDLGEVWRLDERAHVLRRVCSWRAPTLDRMAAFEAASSRTAYEPGSGLIGRAFTNGAPAWLYDILEDATYERSTVASHLGLRSALAFPIRSRRGVEGVIAFFAWAVAEPDEGLLEMLADIGVRVGEFVARDQVDQAQHILEAMFLKAFHTSPVPMVVSGLLDGRFIEANERFLRMFGFERNEVLGRTAKELGMWADARQRAALVDRVREDGFVRDADVTVRTKSGEARQALLSTARLELAAQPAVITTLVDMTEIERAREAQAQLAAIVQGSDDAIIGKTLDGRITSWNASAERMYGYTAAEAIGKTISIIVPAERRQEFEAVMERLRRGERIDRLETVRLRKDGRRIVAAITLSPIRDSAGRVTGASSIAYDVTDRKRSEQLLRRSEARFRQMFEVAADAILLIDGRGTILDINPAGAELLGVTDAAAMRGINMAEIIPPPELERARTYLRDLLRGAPVEEPFETYVEPPRARPRFLQVRSKLMREEGIDPYLQVIARDVSEQKETQIRLLNDERQTTLGQVAGFVAHEINTPLTNIALLTASLLRQVTDADLRERLEKINAQRRLAASSITDLVSLTRSTQMQRLETDLRNVVQAVIDQVGRYAKDGVELLADIAEEPVIGLVEPLRLQQAILNLVRNAFQSTTQGHVLVRLKATSAEATITVADTGSGMTSEVRERLFQPFFTTRPFGEGIGLGLVFAGNVVEAHGGIIEVRSEPGHGSAFTLRIPLRPAIGSPAAPGPTADEPEPKNGPFSRI